MAAQQSSRFMYVNPRLFIPDSIMAVAMLPDSIMAVAMPLISHSLHLSK